VILQLDCEAMWVAATAAPERTTATASRRDKKDARRTTAKPSPFTSRKT
jgi:hypothetical protein